MTRACAFVPPFLLQRIADSGHPTAGLARETLLVDQELRATRATERLSAGLAPAGAAEAPTPQAWTVHDAEQGTRLPGRPVRRAGEPPADGAGDEAVDEAAAGLTAALRFFREALGRDSYDGEGAETLLTVHYRKDYDNAFWDGSHLVFGDGDGQVFERFTKPLDVLGHEFGHAVTDHSAGLVYADQPGALNESVSDVLAVCLSHWLAGHTVEEGSWLIGEGLFRPGIRARALRDLAAPGTAYDDPLLGRDPQVGHMDDYVVTREDNGGVHLNSGIPSRAFHLAATRLGGRLWERAGMVWYAALTGGAVSSRTDFSQFAAVTVAVARERLGEAAADVVADAWHDVGVRDPGEAGAGDGMPAEAGRRLRVRRTGGFAGITLSAELDLEGEDPRAAEARQLVGLMTLPHALELEDPAGADRFVYTFEAPGVEPLTLSERDLTPSLRRLADLLLVRRGEPRA